MNKKMHALEKLLVWQEKSRLSSPEVWAAATSMAWVNSVRTEKNKEGSASRMLSLSKFCCWEMSVTFWIFKGVSICRCFVEFVFGVVYWHERSIPRLEVDPKQMRP